MNSPSDQTPRTEAGRRLLGLDTGPEDAYWVNLSANEMRRAILAIEAEARAEVYALLPLEREVGAAQARAEGLRQAAERVRAIDWSSISTGTWRHGIEQTKDAAVRAILEGETE